MSAPPRGRVIHFAYLWLREQQRQRVEATKDRPCVVLLVDGESNPGSELVSVLPITHSPPESPDDAFELLPATKARLGLDDARSWIVVTEVNDFTFPGYDLRSTPDGRPDYGSISPKQYDALRKAFESHARRGTLGRVDRND